MKFKSQLIIIFFLLFNGCTPNYFANNIKEEEAYFVIQYKAIEQDKIHTFKGRSLNDSTIIGEYANINHSLYENANIGDTLYKKRGEYEYEVRKKDEICIFPFIYGTAVYRNGGVHHLEPGEPHFTCTPRK